MVSRRPSKCCFLSRFFLILLSFLLVAGLLPTYATAVSFTEEASLILTGKGYFTLDSSTSQLFHLENAVPGDVWQGQIHLVNETTGRMDAALLSIENDLEDSLLFDILELQIKHNGETLYSGPYGTGADAPVFEFISIPYGKTEVLDVTVTFPAIAGNEYQGRNMLSTWTFEARTDAQPSYPHNVTYQYAGDIPEDAPALPPVRAYYYGHQVTVAQAPAIEGYDFIWSTPDADISTGSFRMPGYDVFITGTWTKQTSEEDYSVTYEYTGDIPENAPDLPDVARYKPGEQVSVAASPTVDGYTFVWSTDDVEVKDGSFEMPQKDVVFTGIWTKKTAVNPNDPPQTGVDLITETVRDGGILWIMLLAVLGTVIISLRIYSAQKNLKGQERGAHHEKKKY